MDGASGAGTPELEVRLLGPHRGGAGRRRPSRSAGRSRARCSRCSRSSPAASSPSTGSSRRSGPASRPRRRRTPCRSTSRSSARRSGPRRSRRVPPGYVLELEPERVDVHRFARLAQEGRAALEGGDPDRRRGRAARGARALARPGARRLPLRAVRADRDRPARGAAARSRSRSGSRPTSRSAATPSSSPSSRRSSRRTRSASGRARSSCSRSTARAGRPTRSPRTAARARRSSTSSGIDPGPELRELEAAILRQDESLAARGDAARAAADAVPAARHDPLRRRRRVDGARGGARPRGARTRPAALLRDGVGGDRATRRHRGEVRGRRGHGGLRHPRLARGRRAPRRSRRARHPRRDRGAQRAARAQHGVGLEIRIGIETGEVVATPTDARQRLVTGEAVGIAAKLEAAAERGRDRRRRARGSPHRPRRDARAAGSARDQGQARARPGVPARRDRARRARVRAAPGRAARRPQARARGAAAIAEARGRRRGRARRCRRRARPASASRGSPPSSTRRAKGVTTLWGRCLSYGEGITYWPLREVARPGG